ncbi:MAG: hypothetical protein JWM01_2641, partial [Arthrobacter sp.]|nr:hypothetical protein [Arthrobacter sp.]
MRPDPKFKNTESRTRKRSLTPP